MILGGPKCWKSFEQDGWTVYFHWMTLADMEDHPCAFFVPTRWAGRNPPGCAPFVFPFRDAWGVAKSDGYATPQARDTALQMCECTGTFPAKDTLRKAEDAILKAVEDLKNMPPMQLAGYEKEIGKALGEIRLKSQGRVVGETTFHAPTAEETLEIK